MLVHMIITIIDTCPLYTRILPLATQLDLRELGDEVDEPRLEEVLGAVDGQLLQQPRSVSIGIYTYIILHVIQSH